MNIILLSGGAGKRLWPISNDIRSKQFIKLFKSADSYESMVQRVYRQITTIAKDANVTIATAKEQACIIKNQLGTKVSICEEPARRDTFPAIALASSYLHDVLSVDEADSVVVCPVDPYVDDSYYETVKELSALAKSGSSDLYLMGINPTYPSDKYGYIIPDGDNKVSKVLEFKEKPDVEHAREYISRHALWNGGVFAFKLEYILGIAHKLIDFKDYYDLLDKYESLNRISFDYAVVEKAKNIDVVRYNGTWKDVGSWDVMSSVLKERTLGNVTIDASSTNTTIINELNIPILALGTDDMIIAAGIDGILISKKNMSEEIKSYVDRITSDVKYVEKEWGHYSIIDSESNSKTVKISINENEVFECFNKGYKSKIWTVTSGSGLLNIDGIEKDITTGNVVEINKGSSCSVKAIEDLEIIEVIVKK